MAAKFRLSVTEMPHFRRLVEFVEEVERHADEECDLALKEIVRLLRSDLLHLMVEYRKHVDLDDEGSP
jgi:hypothetical protein